MEELKKAYADIILHTSKEAAARVMVSERKALRLQNELRNTKDEGLRLLMRMKQMLDFKQRKIDELEAQLQEAEDVITDIRADLYNVQEELEKVKIDKVVPVSRQFTDEDATSPRNPATKPMVICFDSIGGTTKISNMNDEALSPSVLGSNLSNRNCCTQILHAFDGNELVVPISGKITNENESFPSSPATEPFVPSSDSIVDTITTSDVKNETLNPSILDSSFYNRNGSTQRVRAFEGNSVAEKETCFEMYTARENLGKVHGQLRNEDKYSPNTLTKLILPSSDSLADTTMTISDMIDGTLNASILDSNCRNRNGGTQRIRALEGKLLDVKEPHEDIKNEFIMKASNKDEVKHAIISSPTIKNLETKTHLSDEVIRISLARKWRRTKFLKPNEGASLIDSISNGDMTTYKNINCLQENPQCKSSYLSDDNMVFHEGKRKLEGQNRDKISSSITAPPNHRSDISQPSSALTRCKAITFSIKGKVKSSEDQSKTNENEAKIKPFPCLDPGLTLIKSKLDPISGSRNITLSMKALNASGIPESLSKKDSGLIEENTPAKQAGDSKVKSVVNISVSNLEFASTASANSVLDGEKASKTSNGSYSQADNNEFLRYSRKRKKNSLSNTDNIASPVNTSEKISAGDENSGSIELEKSNPLPESSRDSRRLAQVARQLISLSGKRR